MTPVWAFGHVKRKSGFLVPFFSGSANLGIGSATPYYWAISDDKDMTFTPKLKFEFIGKSP